MQACQKATWFEKLAEQARTPRDALADFCREELGLGIDDLLGAWAQPALAVLEEHRDALDAAEVDAPSREMLGRVLRVAWRRRGLNDPSAEIDEETRGALEGARMKRDEQASA